MKPKIEFQINGKWRKSEDIPVPCRRKVDRREKDLREGDRRK